MAISLAWWEIEEEATLVSTFTSFVDQLKDRDTTRRIAYRVYDDLYEGRSLYAMENSSALAEFGRSSAMTARTLNFARNAVDFVHSKCCSETPSVRAAGHGGKWKDHIKARMLSKFIQGAEDDLGFEVNLPRSFLNALRTGTGCVKVTTESGKVAIEVTSPREFMVDSDDGRHGDPRVLYQCKPVDRRSLMLRFPDRADYISRVAVTTDTQVGTFDPWLSSAGVIDAIDLMEGWCLPMHDEPGRHVICVQGCLLLDEEWTSTRFPVAFLRLTERRPGGGFWSDGLLSLLDSVQMEIDDTVAHLGRSIRENNLKIFISDDADISPDVLADPTVGNIIRLASGARPPDFVTPQGASEQEIRWLEMLVRWLYTMAGMDEASASGAQASRLSSGRAILFQHDMQSNRYIDYVKRYGSHVVDVIDRIIDAAKRLDTEGSWKVRYAKGSVVRELDWADVDMDRDAFVLELEEVSPVPDTFAGRLQQIEEDAAAGRIPPEYLVQLREDPDLWWFSRRTSRADLDMVEFIIEQLSDAEQPIPDVYDEQNLQLTIDALRSEIQNAIVMKADSDVIARMQQYLGDVVQAQKNMADEAKAQAAIDNPPPASPVPQAPMGPGAPIAQG